MQPDHGPASVGERTRTAAAEGRGGPRLRGRRMIFMLILLLAWIATFFQGNTGAAAEKACYETIRAALHDSGSIAFSNVTRSGSDPVWTVNVTADAQSPQGAATHVEYACRISHERGSADWTVETLSR